MNKYASDAMWSSAIGIVMVVLGLVVVVLINVSSPW